MNDALGDRMKHQYESRTRFYLPRRTYTILRVDGKAFHTLTRECERPFDPRLMSCMWLTAEGLCAEIQGSKMAFVQSDEISVLLTDFDSIQTSAWFDGNIQKIVSVSAAIATREFNYQTKRNKFNLGLALFDARVFTIPDRTEVENYFIWRQNDAARNSVQMVGRAHFSHKELEGLSCAQIQEKLFQEKKLNWNDLPPYKKRGVMVYRHTGAPGWTHDLAIPMFTQERRFLSDFIPRYDTPQEPS